MSEQWHLGVNGQQSGPHPLDELRAKLRAMDLSAAEVKVWAPSTGDWVDPRTVPGLMDPVGVTAPAAQGVPAAPAAASAVAAAVPVGAVDPYASPKTVAVSEREFSEGELGNHPLDIIRCLKEAWELTKANLGSLVLFGLVYFGVVFAVAIPLEIAYAVAGGASFDPSAGTQDIPAVAQMIKLVSQVVQNLLSIFLGLGALLYALNHVRRNNPELSNLFGGGPYFVSALLASIVFFAVVMVGMLFFILPGIYLAIRLGQYQLVIIDRQLGPIEALKASWMITKGNVWNLIGMGILIFGIVMLGMLALLVGLIWALPLAYLSWATAYQLMGYGERSLVVEG